MQMGWMGGASSSAPLTVSASTPPVTVTLERK
jgi:hypothetical protein